MGKEFENTPNVSLRGMDGGGNTSQSVVEYILQLNNRLKRCQDIAITRMKECPLKRENVVRSRCHGTEICGRDLCCMKGNTRNRWRDWPVCPAADKELWRLGPDSSGQEKKRPKKNLERESKKEKTGEKTGKKSGEREKEKKTGEKTKSPRESEKDEERRWR
ncbi:hypothetical protein TNCV_895981 [Trichonephila clavipes]|nr:hypothetical protein TNCV_895981 [Trichonephila clavipes]